ncbi:uncharacterized protein [Clytia hemisphaerica]|uniref:uncharacterized protein n=1 Tax=Clytia hemisphaerica TaxID=252671 RepID=UPI0034D5BDE0
MMNKTISNPHHDHSHQRIFQSNTGLHQKEILLLIPICVIAVLENVLVCVMIFLYRKLRNTTNIFIFGLCVTNCLFAGVLLPMHCFQKTNEAYLYLTIIIILIYICNLTGVTLERYVAVTRPLHYVNIITKPRAIRIVLACYLLPTIYCLIPMAWQSVQTSLVHKVYITFTLVVFLILPLMFILVVYARVYQETHKFFKKHKALFFETSQSKTENQAEQKTETNFLEVTCFFLCICNKNIAERSSVRHQGDSSSLTNSSECDLFIENVSPRDTFQRSSLYKHVLQISASDSQTNSTTSATSQITTKVIENNGSESETEVFEQSIKELKCKLKQSRSFDGPNTRCPSKKHRSKSENHSPISSRLINKSSNATSLDSFKINYSRTCKKAKAKLIELKASSAFAMVSLTYMFTWLPVVYMTFLEVIDQLHHIPTWMSTTSVYTIGFGAMMDPLLYGFLLRDFRKAINSTIKKRKKSTEWLTR